MKTRAVVDLVTAEVRPVKEKDVMMWANRYLGEVGQGHSREWSEREVLAFYTYHAVYELAGSRSHGDRSRHAFYRRAARAILLGLPLAGAIWSNGTRFVACEPSEASERVFREGGWALPIGKWRMRVRRWMLRSGSPRADQGGWDEIVRDSLERQEIDRAMSRHPAGRDFEPEPN